MNEIKKNNQLSDEQLDNVSGGAWNFMDMISDNMHQYEVAVTDRVLEIANSWVPIENGKGEDERGKFYYEISYNKITGERREQRCYYVLNDGYDLFSKG